MSLNVSFKADSTSDRVRFCCVLKICERTVLTRIFWNLHLKRSAKTISLEDYANCLLAMFLIVSCPRCKSKNHCNEWCHHSLRATTIHLIHIRVLICGSIILIYASEGRPDFHEPLYFFWNYKYTVWFLLFLLTGIPWMASVSCRLCSRNGILEA